MSATQPAAFPIVGIGASAGGLEAFREMLTALSSTAGMAYVLVLHLPARHESMLSEILARVSPLPVVEVHDGMAVEPHHVYVLPAGCDIELEEGHVKLRPREAAIGQHRPIDHFFHSLAESVGHRAIGVVLSGSASDGAVGVQEIKAAGGITFAQDDTAQQNSMPRSAIQTGAIDFVLRPGDIARELARIAAHPILANAPAAENEELPDGPIIEILHEVSGVDFTHYKRNTLARRIARRMVLHRQSGVAEYLRMLESDSAEVKALYQDILINVTSFFRNPEAFDALKDDVFPVLTRSRSRHDPIRVWTVGCSTGEEAYSIAIAYSEFAEVSQCAVPIQIFATDLNSISIDKARSGVYSRSAVADVSPEWVRRFFVELDGSYRIAKPVRDACIFARHNVLEDPPFSRIDLVTCRNMLIYLGSELQQKVIPILHYALRPTGFLWLGSSETIGSYRDLFTLENTKYKIYVKRGERVAVPPITYPPARVLPKSAGHVPPLVLAESRMFDPVREVDRVLLSRYAPPAVVVRDDLEIIHFRGNVSPYLAPVPGRASLNLLKMLREGLVMGVRAAVQRALAEEAPVRQEGLVAIADGVERRVSIEAIPIKSGVQRAETLIVLFEEQPRRTGGETTSRPAADTHENRLDAQEVAGLKQELTATREYLQSVIEQQEAANEELQSANEEVQSANEELQSINEELETSKEEVQSSNEELATVNNELHGRNMELAQTNNDLVNLLASVQMAIVMLGPNLRIRRFTPMAEKLLNLIPTDVGRPVSDIKINLNVPDLEQLVADAIDKMEVREREVHDNSGTWYLLRVRPYRTMENKIDGAVLVLVDVDSLKRSQEMLRQQTELLDQAHEPIVMWGLETGITYWNKAAEDAYGFTREQAEGRRVHELLLSNPDFQALTDELRTRRYWTGEIMQTRRDGQKIIVESRMVVVTDTQGRQVVVQADRPITERKESERFLRNLADDLTTADRNKDEFLAMLAHELRNPLAPLRNVASILKSDAVGAEQKSRAIDIMERQVQIMARLIDDLLDASRMTLSMIELRKAPVDIAASVRRVAEQQEDAIRAENQRLRLELPDRPLYVAADEVRLEQILGNLLNNACKYTPAEGEISVSVQHERAHSAAAEGVHAVDHVAIRVRDNGIGIEANKLPRVFDLFMRATRSSDQRYGGLGLGLTIVRRLVELHGGTVEAHSAGLGKGSEFLVRLPMLADAATLEPPLGQREEPARSTKRILVVDDESDSRESTAMILRMAGHEVAIAESGSKALELAGAFRPEVALVDIGMPGMDGYELARRLRESIDGAVRMIAVSGYGHVAARERAKDAGFDGYLVKPAGFEDVVRVIS